MRSRGTLPLLWLALGLLLAAPLQAGETCEVRPARGPVSLIILANGQKVQELARSVKDGQVVARDAETVIFADGRVITADVDAAGEHLNQLGWGARRIQISATFPARRARPRSAPG